jgi:hypothetical protein
MGRRTIGPKIVIDNIVEYGEKWLKTFGDGKMAKKVGILEMSLLKTSPQEPFASIDIIYHDKSI